MGNFGTPLASALLNHIFGKASFDAPSGIDVALSSTQPTDAGTNVTEPVGNGYARKQTVPADWNSAPARILDNAVAIEFAEASGPWLAGVNLTHFALYAAVSGLFLGWGALTAPKPIGVGDTARFNAGDLVVQFTASV